MVPLNLPPLRERGDDVLTLSQHFIERFNRLYTRQVQRLSPEAADIFRRYAWPGNVRELENLLERIFILEDEDIVLPRHLPDRILRSLRAGAWRRAAPGRRPPATSIKPRTTFSVSWSDGRWAASTATSRLPPRNWASAGTRCVTRWPSWA